MDGNTSFYKFLSFMSYILECTDDACCTKTMQVVPEGLRCN